ncbi:hypothetical protein OIDMADRAFT_20477 [Oidiodendron maius Zn]|uniref:Uncharacterized protein n=1 Tax=Oidiodendron maius (strain Zn) TaxID=913774 RepID=A0A0C3H448_OIDMZ|nr:hypothetical protein OIDMADRAFT_20477 [Oidiodendron maius Zn]
MRLCQRLMFAIFSIYTMCQLHILAAPAGTGDNQALDNQNSGETSSKKDEAKAARMAKINERAKKIAEDNKKRHAAAIAKGNVYELYDPNDIDIV